MIPAETLRRTSFPAILLVTSSCSTCLENLRDSSEAPTYVAIAGGECIRVGNPEPTDSPMYHRCEAQTTVTINGFEIARYLVTAREYCDFLNSAYAKNRPRELMWATDHEYVYPVATIEFAGDVFRPREGKSKAPANRVSWVGAVEYCRWLSSEDPCGYLYRLPSEAEWEVMARGQEFRQWPWGDDPPDARRGYRWERKQFDPLPWRAVPDVGRYPAGATPEGVMDVMGYDLYEWCANRYTEHVENHLMRDMRLTFTTGNPRGSLEDTTREGKRVSAISRRSCRVFGMRGVSGRGGVADRLRTRSI